MKYYAIAFNEEGQNFVIDNLPEERIHAVNKAFDHCKSNNLILQGVYPVKGTGKQSDTLTKMTPEKRSRKLYWVF